MARLPVSGNVIAKYMKNSLGVPRMSNTSRAKMAEVTIDYIAIISQKALELATHAGRKTVNDEDIELASSIPSPNRE